MSDKAKNWERVEGSVLESDIKNYFHEYDNEDGDTRSTIHIKPTFATNILLRGKYIGEILAYSYESSIKKDWHTQIYRKLSELDKVKI